jgi:hypothetical protein
MAFNGNFTVTPDNTDTSKFTLTDTSTGSDVNLTDRVVYLYKTDGTTIVPEGTTTEYIDWPLDAVIGDTLEVDVLDKDYALSVSVIWTSSDPEPDPSEYQKTTVTAFTAYSYLFWYTLIQQMGANANLAKDNNFIHNLMKLGNDVDNAEVSEYFSDQFSAQAALNRIYNMIVNQSIYF